MKHLFTLSKPKKILTYLTLSLLFITNCYASVDKIKELNVYTYSSFASSWGPGPKIKAAFEKKYDCTVNFIALDDGVSILNRIRLEGKYTKADILLGLDNNLISDALATGLIAPHKQDLSNLTLKNFDNKYFIPFDYGTFAFVYNKELLKNPPTSLKELVERSDLRVIYQDPRTSTPGLGLLLWMKTVFKDDSFNAWKKLSTHTITITKGWSEAYGMFLKGEADMVLSYTTSPAYHMIAEKTFKYQAAKFDEGHYLQVEIAAKLINAPSPKLADLFMEFILSGEFQNTIATGNWMYPAQIDKALPPEFEQLIKPEITLEQKAELIAKNRNIWVKEWLEALSD